MLDLLPQWLRDGIGDDVAFWIGYLTNGKHLAWYASVQFTLFAAVFGGLVALLLGLGAAAVRNSAPWPFRMVAAGYINVVRGVPDVLFFLFFPLAFEQTVECLWSSQVCTPELIAAQSAAWPPCKEANWFLGTPEYLILASVSLGLVYGAFATNVIHGALRSVPRGQLEAARAYGMSPFTVFRRIWLPRAIHRALPTLNGETVLQLKSTPLVATITVIDVYAVISKVRQETYITYEPLLLLALIYLCLTAILVVGFRTLENRIPSRGA